MFKSNAGLWRDVACNGSIQVQMTRAHALALPAQGNQPTIIVYALSLSASYSE